MPRKSEYRCRLRPTFAAALKNWRHQNKIPLKQIASDLGLSVAIVNKWERGERFPTGKHFELLAEYTGQPPCQFFCALAEKCRAGACLLKQRPQP